jgi:hypothetical protein
MSLITQKVIDQAIRDLQPKGRVGRPLRLFTCNSCGKVLGSAAVRSHKCPKSTA